MFLLPRRSRQARCFAGASAAHFENHDNQGKLVFFRESTNLLPISAPLHAPNPYREILRREIPEPFIALLCFILGIWMWDHYFGPTAGYPPGTEQTALIRIDRDIQLAEAMADDPPFLRWLAHAQTPAEAVAVGLRSLEMLAGEQPLGPEASRAYAALLAARDKLPAGRYLANFHPSDETAVDPATWWNLRIISGNALPAPPPHADALRTRAIVVGSIIWGLGLIGLAFFPAAFRCLRGAFRKKARGYAAAWTPSLGIVVFLVATLAWIGFTMVVELGIMQMNGINPVLLILLDTAARILPTIIALALLFRKASHIPKAIGLNGDIHPPVLLGLFSLLVLIDQPLRWVFGRFTPDDPTGGLSHADAGVSGLVFLIVSACLIAPLAEEILYRGILHRSLANRMGVLAGALLSSAIFASLHFYDWYGLASVATFGFICALAYQSTGSLINVIVLHMIYNISITLPEWVIYHAPL